MSKDYEDYKWLRWEERARAFIRTFWGGLFFPGFLSILLIIKLALVGWSDQ